ncbi:DNA helicase [Tanacetum coccineum]|uniref:ATP-dependent DNA helicase n=1 Tax=Tanacetum coccineum TaxID=301880 RepID=A0ABQ4X0J8_9ASTR
MENANLFVLVPPNRLRARITQELNELRAVPTIINSHLENIGHVHIPFPPPVPFEQLLDVFINPPDVLEMDDSDSDSEFIDTPLVSPFLDSDEELDDEEVLNELNEYGNAENITMPRAIPRLKNFEWSKIPPIVVLSQWDLMRGLKHPHEKNKLMYKNCLNLGPEYQVDEDMKEWLICKTFLWKTIIYALCSEGKIVLAVASSSIASLLLPAGRIAHSRFKLPLDLTDASVCTIKKNTTLRDLLNAPSRLWHHFTLYHLTENMRLVKGNMQEADMERVSSFAQWRLDIGDGLTGTPDEIDPENTSWVNIREHYCIPDDENRVSNLINFIYDDNTLRHPTTKELQKKTIVCPKNETTDIINAKVMSMLSGNTHTYMRRGGTIVSHRVPEYSLVCGIATTSTGTKDWYTELHEIPSNDFPEHYFNFSAYSELAERANRKDVVLTESTQQEMPLQIIPDEEQSISETLVAPPLDLPFGTRWKRTSICTNTNHWNNKL